jgi:hypothetical protein
MLFLTRDVVTFAAGWVQRGVAGLVAQFIPAENRLHTPLRLTTLPLRSLALNLTNKMSNLLVETVAIYC